MSITHQEIGDCIAHETQVDPFAQASPLADNTREDNQIGEHVRRDDTREEHTQRAELVIGGELVHKAL